MGSDLVVDIDAQPESTTKHPITASARPRKEVFFFMRIEVGAVGDDLGFGAKNEYASSCRPPSLAAELTAAPGRYRKFSWTQQCPVSPKKAIGSLSDLEIVGCKSTAAVHFSPPFCPIAWLWGCKSGKNCPCWGRFSLSTLQVRQAPGRAEQMLMVSDLGMHTSADLCVQVPPFPPFPLSRSTRPHCSAATEIRISPRAHGCAVPVRRAASR